MFDASIIVEIDNCDWCKSLKDCADCSVVIKHMQQCMWLVYVWWDWRIGVAERQSNRRDYSQVEVVQHQTYRPCGQIPTVTGASFKAKTASRTFKRFQSFN